MMIRSVAASLLVVGVLGASGCAMISERFGDKQSTAGQAMDDRTITSRVKERIEDDRSIDSGRLNIETLRGTVQLSGFVATAAERARAVQIARAVPEVKAVRDDIIVRTGN
jgi:hyperosmotically inducible protein